MKIIYLFTVCVLHQASGVIYSLNDTEYDRLPPLFKLDEFYPCLRSPGDQYCYVNARLTANTSSKLLHVIQEYSANNITHYDHGLIHWGICVTKTCRQYLSNGTNLNEALEACISSLLYRTHQLQARLLEDQVFCTEYDETDRVDTVDIIVATVFMAILALNVFGTLYDAFFFSEASEGSKFLLCFSLKRNWRRLFAPSGEGSEPRLTRLKMFNCIRSCATFLVVFGHSPLFSMISLNNPHYIESTYHNPLFHAFYNGNLIVQIFLILSGCLLAFNLLLFEEKTQLTWSKFPKLILLRWMRLTPPYAAVLAITATWMTRIGNGPMWKPLVRVESEVCRQTWFHHLLYFNDYIDPTICLGHTWYLAVDMKLTVLALLLFCALKSWRARKVAISLAFVAGVVATAACTFSLNLYPIPIVSPEVVRTYFVDDPTFNHLYKRTHTNIICYAMGLALGMWIYKLMQTDVDVTKYKKYRAVYWSTIPIGLLLIMCGGIFYMDGVQVPLLARVAYAPLVKFMFGILAFVLIPGTIFKLETVYRGFLEWRGWAVFGRVSYCVYIIHVSVIRISTANHTSLLHTNFLQIIQNYIAHGVLTFILALPCWMLIEAPSNQLVKLCFSRDLKDTQQDSAIKNILRDVIPDTGITKKDKE